MGTITLDRLRIDDIIDLGERGVTLVRGVVLLPNLSWRLFTRKLDGELITETELPNNSQVTICAQGKFRFLREQTKYSVMAEDQGIFPGQEREVKITLAQDGERRAGKHLIRAYLTSDAQTWVAFSLDWEQPGENI